MPTFRILVAPTAFKGTLSPAQAATAIAAGLARAYPNAEIRKLPVADGGDGFLECLARESDLRYENVTGPLGESVTTPWALRGDRTAIVESAKCCGLTLIPEGRRDPLRTTSRGLGELLCIAELAGAEKALVGLGGSATNDGGVGALQALGWSFVDDCGKELPPGGGSLCRLVRVLRPGTMPTIRISCACDVENPLLGPSGATAVYGPQKGVTTAEQAKILEDGLHRLASFATVAPHTPMAGAAGGLAFGLAAFAGAKLVRGAELVLQELDFDSNLAWADVVVAGEGRLDAQTLFGKIVGEVLRRARSKGIPAYAVCGVLGEGWEALQEFLAAEPARSEDPRDAYRAVSDAASRLRLSV